MLSPISSVIRAAPVIGSGTPDFIITHLLGLRFRSLYTNCEIQSDLFGGEQPAWTTNLDCHITLFTVWGEKVVQRHTTWASYWQQLYYRFWFSPACFGTPNWIVSILKWEAAGAGAQSSWLGYVAKAFLLTVKLGNGHILHKQRRWLKQPTAWKPKNVWRKNDET